MVRPEHAYRWRKTSSPNPQFVEGNLLARGRYVSTRILLGTRRSQQYKSYCYTRLSRGGPHLPAFSWELNRCFQYKKTEPRTRMKTEKWNRNNWIKKNRHWWRDGIRTHLKKTQVERDDDQHWGTEMDVYATQSRHWRLFQPSGRVPERKVF